MTLTQLKQYVNSHFANGAASMADDSLAVALTQIINLVLTGAPLAGNMAGLISDASTDPGTPTVNVVYITTTAGSYTHFLSAPATPIVVAAGTILTFLTFNTGTGYWTATSVSSVAVSGGITSSSATAGIGYATGAGGAITQATNKSTGVTLNKVCGAVTMNGASLAGGASVSFTLTNSAIAATDVVKWATKSSGAAVGLYTAVTTATAAGSCQCTVTNLGATASEAVVLNFVVEKAVAA